MKKILHLATSKIKFIILFYFIVQLTLVLTTHPIYSSDALYYYNLAKECISGNSFYPTHQQTNEDYIIAPLYINIIIVLLRIYNSVDTISFLNILIIALQMLIIYKISVKLFSEHTAKLSIILYIFYLNTLGLMLSNYTELFFLLMVSSSIYFILLNKNLSLLFSGILIGCAIAVRPAAWALMFSLILLQIIEIYRTKIFSLKYFYSYAGILIFIICFGYWTNSFFGKFEFTSTTGPVNLLLGANDDATGGFNSKVFETGKAGYIANPDSMTYIQKGEFYKDAAMNWITEHPVKWLMLAPLKFLHTFGWDDIALSSLLGYDTNFGRVLKLTFVDNKIENALPDTSVFSKIIYFLFLLYNHLFYYSVFILILLGIYNLIIRKQIKPEILLILFFSFFSILMILVTVGTPRYKYPVFILLLPIAAYYLGMKSLSGKKSIETR